MMQAGTPPAEIASGGPKVWITQVPAPLHSLLLRHARLGSAEQNEPTLPKKSQSVSLVPLQLESSPLMLEPVCTAESCAVPVQPVSRSAPGVTTSVSSPCPGQVQPSVHCPGQSASSVPSQSSAACRTSSPQIGAHWQSP